MRLSQTELAAALGITFQQVQKYEKGVNRIGAARLQQIADALEVPVAWFFEGQLGGARNAGKAVKASDLQFAAFMKDRLAPRLMRAFPGLPLPAKAALLDVMEAQSHLPGRAKPTRMRA
jgi:transcriptional regulator with XRE-family HTH domain